MRTVLLGEPPAPVAEWLQQRRALGQDLFDEVWQGDYHVAPAPRASHGDVDDQLAAFLRPRALAKGLWGTGPLNLGQPDDYRVPDRAYLRQRSQAVFVPSAAIVVEISSPDDETYGKFAFYFACGVEELLILEPSTRSAAWYGRGADAFTHAGRSQLLDLTDDEIAAAIDWPPED